MASDSDYKWINSAEAFELILSRTLNEQEAKELFDKRARCKGFSARANMAVDMLDAGPIPLDPPSKTSDFILNIRVLEDEKFVKIRPAFFTGTDTLSPYDSRLWKWQYGILALVFPQPPVFHRRPGSAFTEEPRKCRVFYGVQLARAEVMEFITRIPPKVKSGRGRSGPREKKWSFAKVMFELEKMMIDGTMEAKFGHRGYGTQAKIQRWLTARLNDGDDEPPESTVKRHAAKVMRQWEAFELERE